MRKSSLFAFLLAVALVVVPLGSQFATVSHAASEMTSESSVTTGNGNESGGGTGSTGSEGTGGCGTDDTTTGDSTSGDSSGGNSETPGDNNSSGSDVSLPDKPTPDEVNSYLEEALKRIEKGESVDGLSAVDVVRVNISGGSEETRAVLAKEMCNNPDTLGMVAQLEEVYAKENGWTDDAGNAVSAGIKVNKELTNMIDASKVSIVGALLNVSPNSDPKNPDPNYALTLNINKTYEDVCVPIDSTKYSSKTVQLDIFLAQAEVATDESGDLAVPVQITMPIPNGIDPNKLEVLHYATGDKHDPLPVWFDVDANGNLVILTTTHFSTFVFAEKIGDNADNNDGNNTTTDDTSNDNDTDTGIAPTADQVRRDAVPKTGDGALPMLPFAAASAVCAVVAVVLQKKKA